MHEVKAQAVVWLKGVEGHLTTAGLSHISEIVDAEPLYTPRGCIAQAWIVAELLRAAEDLYEIPLSSDVESAAALA